MSTCRLPKNAYAAPWVYCYETKRLRSAILRILGVLPSNKEGHVVPSYVFWAFYKLFFADTVYACVNQCILGVVHLVVI